MEKQTLEDIVKSFGKSEKDTGSAEVQIALLTTRIRSLSEHLKEHKKDNHSRYGLIKMVGRRRRLLKYLNRTDNDSYKKVLKALELRK